MKKISIVLILIVFAVEIQAQQDSVKAGKFLLPETQVTDTSINKINPITQSFKIDSISPEKKINEKKVRKPSPTLASCLSAVIPGSGQIYNRKYWKVPIVYAGLGTSAFFIYYFHKEYVYYRTEYRLRLNSSYDLMSRNITSSPNPELASMNTENVYSYENTNRRYMEISIIALSVFYILNIVDAAVDAHLTGFNVNEDLSLHVFPYTENNSFNSLSYSPVNLGLTVHFNF